jgi:hypothetical protein
VTLEQVCAELKALGINVDVETIRKYNVSEEQLLQVESNLWQFLRNILANIRSAEIGGAGKN